MKKITTLLCALLCVVAVNASEFTTDTLKNHKPSVAEQHAELISYKHEFRAGAGLLGLSSVANFVDFMSLGLIMDDLHTTPTFSVEYSYRAVQFLQVGAFMTFDSYSYNERSYDDDLEPQLTYRCKGVNSSLGIFARYSWFNRKWVSLYSSLGVSGVVTITSSRDYGSSDDSFDRSSEFCVAPEIVPFGVRVGDKFFGYFEPWAVSSRGFVCLFGVGYKF